MKNVVKKKGKLYEENLIICIDETNFNIPII